MEKYFAEFKEGRACAQEMDANDPLKAFRDRFYIQPNCNYMDGNSLGLCSKDAEKYLERALKDWKEQGIYVWNMENGRYFLYHDLLGERIAKLLINAEPEEVTVTGSTTMNIHSAISTFYKPTKERYKILVDELNFPSDRYAVDSQVKLKGYTVEEAVKVVKSADGKFISEDDIIAAMTDDVALALFPSVLYRSSQLLDMERVTAAARERGIIIGWDLCHSVGAVDHDFKKIQPDFAVWCTYKYLSGGPGSSAGLYINKRHFGMEAGLTGWHGNNKKTQFLMIHKFDPEHRAGGWATGTLPIFAMAPIEGMLDIYEEAGIKRVREKSLRLTAYLAWLIEAKLVKYGCAVGSPRVDKGRGGHISLEHDEAYRICKSLKEHGIVPDFREPNVVRLAPTGLYNRYEDVFNLVEALEKILGDKEYEKFSSTKDMVV